MNSGSSSEKIIYFYHGLVDKNTYMLPRLLSSLLRIPFFKQFFFIFPGIEEALTTKRGQNEGNISVEITPSSLGIFKSNWEIKPTALERLKQVGVDYVSFHAPYVNDGAVNQKGNQSYLDNIFDLTEDTSLNLFCLVSHFQAMDYLTPKKKKVLVVHPLPASADKTETEIIKSSAKLLHKILPLIKDLNIFIGLENMPWLKKKHERYTRYLGSIDFFEKLMNEINDESVGITFDFGHANSYARYMYNNGFKDGGTDFSAEYIGKFGYHKDFLSKLKDKIFHLHLNYNTAHLINEKAPFYASNYDYHGDLTQLSETDYQNFKDALAIVKDSPALLSMVLEIIPSFFSQKSRLAKYNTSVEVLRSMVK